MNLEDKNEYIQRYEKRLEEYGYSPETLGWGKYGRQDIRFSVLSEAVLTHSDASVLDVGCGFADLYDYLSQHDWRGQYTGLEIVGSLLEVARRRQPNLDLRVLDIMDEAQKVNEYDFVIASGIFNAKISTDNYAHITQMLEVMHNKARIATCVDFMSTYVDFQKEGAHHTDPAWALTQALKLSRRVVLRQDYMPFEFALIIYKDDTRNERNIFSGYAAHTLPRP